MMLKRSFRTGPPLFTAAFLCWGLSVTGCASSLQVADRYFSAKDFGKAAISYEIYLREEPRPTKEDYALYRQGLSYLAYGEEVSGEHRFQKYQELAMRSFQRILKDYPRGPFAYRARILYLLQQDLISRNRELLFLKKQMFDERNLLQKLRQKNEGLTREIQGLKGQAQVRETILKNQFHDRSTLNQEIERLQTRLSKQEQHINELLQKLSELKKIDMQRSP
jgi:hypothetical protein